MKFILENFGCQMNVADATEITASLLNNGYSEAKDDPPDIVILNSCAVRDTAEERIYGRIRHYSILKNKQPFTLILMGCVAQKEQTKILENIPDVDLVVGTHEKSHLADILNKHSNHNNVNNTKEITEDRKVYGEFGNFTFYPSVPSQKYPFKADVNIIHGCNKFCSYCIVPYTRGKEISRESQSIIENVKELIDKGITEISLLGQNVNSYGQDTGDISFSKLLSHLNDLEGLKRIRFLTSHPIDFNNELIHVIRDCKKICSYIHLPLQSASDFVLTKMKRDYSFSHYMSIISQLKNKIPNPVLSTDILVGFPYETEKDFEMTLNAMKDIRFDTAFMFKYSIREGTESASYPDLSEEDKKRRLQLIIDTQHKITKEQNEKDLGKIEEVLLESKSKRNPDQLLGKTEGNKPVIVRAKEDMIGQYVQLKLNSLKGNAFLGEFL